MLSILILICALLCVVPSRRAFDGDGDLAQQPAQQPADTSGKVDEGKDVRTLEPGPPLQRELADGQQHSYRIGLNAGQFLNVVVEQRGIDLAVQLSGPDGRQILTFDSENGPQGEEPVPLVAEATGSYVLTVRPSQKGAASGGYRIRIEELRAAADRDRSLQEARQLFEQYRKLLNASKFDEALPIIERVLQIREKILGPDHSEVATTLNGLAVVHYYQGEYAKAEPLYRRALEIREKVLGPDHANVGAVLNNLAVILEDRGEYAKAEPLYRRALEIREKALGPEHSMVADSLNNLGIFYRAMGEYAKAEPLFQRSLEIRQKVLGADHPNVANSLNSLAGYYRSIGKYAKAEPFYRRALELREKALGPEHKDVAESLHNLANLYFERGEYARAEPLYGGALAILEKIQGPKHRDVAMAVDNLALLYTAAGDYEQAEPLYWRALEIREKVLGSEHAEVADSLTNLGLLYQQKEEYAKAEPLHRRALEIRERALGPGHSEVAVCLNNLAIVYRVNGEYAKAESLYRRALKISEKALGPEHRYVASTLFNLALLYRSMGEYAKAEPLYQRSLEIREKALGPDNFEVAESLDSLAVLCAAKGEIARALTFQSRANAIGEQSLVLNLVTGSERQKLAYLDTLTRQTNQTISFHVRYAPDDRSARSLAASLILQRKGRALDAVSETLNALRDRFNPEDQALLDQLTETRSEIARLVLAGPQNAAVERYRQQLKTLEDLAENLESRISRRSNEFRAQSLPITLEAVQAAVPADAALVEFVSYRPLDAKAGKDNDQYGPGRYLAYVIHRQGEIEWKEIGEVRAIDEIIAALRLALRDPRRKDVKRLARAVSERVFEPLRPLIGDSTRLLISPDGALNLVPFAALVDRRGQYLVQRYSISYLASGRDLLRLQVARESQTGPLVIADPDFGGSRQTAGTRILIQKQGRPTGQPGEQGREEPAISTFDRFYFPALPYTAEEGKAVRATLPDATLLTRRQASKAALKQIRSPLLLHIATHGFFLENLKQPAPVEQRSRATGGRSSRHLRQIKNDDVRVESPLLRSGLALAGANEHRKDDNGILTALEVTGLNLWGTKLVVLSACDTGVGEVRNWDGVHGLRRALVLAGSETQVISLWSVSDRWTQVLMVAYYQGLQQGSERGEALRQVQLKMLKNVKRRHPYYWASFIQSGEWTSLDRK